MNYYLSLNEYKKVFNKLKNVDFKVVKTNYSKIIKTKGKNFIFNEKGRENKNMLMLINKVKKDAKHFINIGKFDNKKRYYFNWYKKNEFVNYYNKEMNIYKLDINAAYWVTALNEGIISDKTNDFWDELTWDNDKEKKKARLRALGSLATIKTIEEYIGGKLVKQEVKKCEYRELYLYICSVVGGIMEELMYICGGAYYYWDCVWIEESKLELAKEFLRGKGYEFKVESDKVKVINNGVADVFYSIINDIKYPINVNV